MSIRLQLDKMADYRNFCGTDGVIFCPHYNEPTCKMNCDYALKRQLEDTGLDVLVQFINPKPKDERAVGI